MRSFYRAEQSRNASILRVRARSIPGRCVQVDSARRDVPRSGEADNVARGQKTERSGTLNTGANGKENRVGVRTEPDLSAGWRTRRVGEVSLPSFVSVSRPEAVSRSATTITV